MSAWKVFWAKGKGQEFNQEQSEFQEEELKMTEGNKYMLLVISGHSLFEIVIIKKNKNISLLMCIHPL